MARVTWGSDCRDVTLPVYKAWLVAMDLNLLACGLARTSDTGQLDPVTLASVPSTGGYSLPMLYKFTDPLAASSPVIVKLRPYVGSYGGYPMPGIAFEVGFATDTAGNMVGVRSGEFNYFNSAAGSALTFTPAPTPSYAVHSEGYLGLCLNLGRGANAYGTYCVALLAVTRTLAGGVAIARQGLPFTGAQDVTGMRLSKGMLSVGEMSAWNQDLSPWIGGAAAASAGGSIQMQRTYSLTPAITADPALSMYWNTSVTQGDVFSLSVDGLSRDYLALSNKTGVTVDTLNANNIGLAMLWPPA